MAVDCEALSSCTCVCVCVCVYVCVCVLRRVHPQCARADGGPWLFGGRYTGTVKHSVGVGNAACAPRRALDAKHARGRPLYPCLHPCLRRSRLFVWRQCVRRMLVFGMVSRCAYLAAGMQVTGIFGNSIGSVSPNMRISHVCVLGPAGCGQASVPHGRSAPECVTLGRSPLTCADT